MPRLCKACHSPNRDYIEEQLQNRVAARVIIEELARRGEVFNQNNISTHRRLHWEPIDPLEGQQEQMVRELQQEMAMAPAGVAPLYMVVIRQLEHLKYAKPSADVLVRATEAITRVTGLQTKQQLLLAYAERMFGGLPEGQSSTETQQLPPPPVGPPFDVEVD